jgi:hypothetical protein
VYLFLKTFGAEFIARIQTKAGTSPSASIFPLLYQQNTVVIQVRLLKMLLARAEGTQVSAF